MNKDDLMTTEEVANMLRMSPAWVREACRRNELPHYKLGNQYRFVRSEIEESITRLAS
jgi:excisionase family DNA binding protein